MIKAFLFVSKLEVMGNAFWQIWSLKTMSTSPHVFPTLGTLVSVLSMVSVAARTQIT